MKREADTGNDSFFFFFCLLLPSFFLLPSSSYFLVLSLPSSLFLFLLLSSGFDSVDSARFTGFHYVDWIFDGPDILFAPRTGYRGANTYVEEKRGGEGRRCALCAVRCALYVVRCVLCAVCCVLCAVCYACIDTGATLSFFLQVPQRQPNDRKADPELRRPLRSQHGQLYLAKNVHAARVGVVPSHYGVRVVRGASERYGVRTALHGGCIRGGRGHVPELR